MGDDLDLLIRVSTTADDLTEGVPEVLGRVVVDEGVDAGVEVGQAVPENHDSHVETIVRYRTKERSQKMNMDGEPEHSKRQHNQDQQQTGSLLLGTRPVT